MTDRERLIELIWNSIANRLGTVFRENVEDIADDLLANGVIVPPCKVGDTVYYINKEEKSISEFVVYSMEFVLLKNNYMSITIQFTDNTGHRNFDYQFRGESLYETFFLTKEEAEKALKEREQNDRN